MTARTAAAPAARPAPPTGAWLKLSAALAGQVPDIAGRPDLIVTCAPGAGHGAPACFFPALALIEVDGNCLGVDPATADPASPADRERYRATWGALIHECAHAAHTRWAPPPAATAAWAEAARMLEESRIEAAQTTRRPADRRWIRAAITDLVVQDFAAAAAPPASAQEAGSAAALILARADTGILETTETGPVARAVTAVIGAPRLAALRKVWQAAQATADDDARTMLKFGRRWCRILGIQPDTPPPPAPARTPGSAPSPVGRAVAQAAAAITAAVAAENAPLPAGPPGKAAQRAAENTARTTAASAASAVFSPGGPPPRRAIAACHP